VKKKTIRMERIYNSAHHLTEVKVLTNQTSLSKNSAAISIVGAGGQTFLPVAGLKTQLTAPVEGSMFLSSSNLTIAMSASNCRKESCAKHDEIDSITVAPFDVLWNVPW
jgi:hypothetical protein